MAWTTPRTWVAHVEVLDVHLNAHLRDNLLATMPGAAASAGQFFVSLGLNKIVARDIGYSLVAATVTLTTGSALSYQTLTGGPSVTIDTGTTALALWGCTLDGTVGQRATHGVNVVGQTSQGYIVDRHALTYTPGRAAGFPFRGMSAFLFKGLTAGSKTFMSYYAYGGPGNTATFSNRFLLVMAL